MRVLICGSRDFMDAEFLNSTLDMLHSKYHFTCVIEGEAMGADKLSAAWAARNDVPVEKYPADWNRYGRGAGPVRNKQMITSGKPDRVIAFSYAIAASKGTANMMRQAEQHDIPVEFYGK